MNSAAVAALSLSTVPSALAEVTVPERVFPVFDIADRSPTPPMGFSFWNAFGSQGSCDLFVRQTGETLVSKGLKDCGYDMLLAFDGSWYSTDVNPGRDADGRMLTDAKRWPNGIKAVSDFVHSKGLKVGGYTDIGQLGYCNPRQRGFQPQDVQQYSEWGWDYIKIDDRGRTGWLNVVQPLVANMKRPIIISLSTPGTFPFEFGPRISNLWRVGSDILAHKNDRASRSSHSSFWQVLKEFDKAEQYWWAQAPGRWNDLDMMVVGCRGISDEEAKSHFSMWAERGAPLLISTDLRDPSLDPEGLYPKINETQLGILKNREVIAVDQDSLGATGRKVPSTGGEVYAKPLQAFTSGKVAVLFLNRTGAVSDIRVNWSSLGLKPAKAKVRDLWVHSDLGAIQDGWTAKAVPPHGVVMLIVEGEYDWDRPRSYEAESSYNTFTGLAYVVAYKSPEILQFSSNAGVTGVGNDLGNSLQFNRVAVQKTGRYNVAIAYACAADFSTGVSINGAAPLNINFPRSGDGNAVKEVVQEMELKAGENTLRFESTTTQKPLFDKITIR